MAEPTRCTRHLQGKGKGLLINEPEARASRQAGRQEDGQAGKGSLC
jgi:hypothetical protein